ncbi:hypothetical protein VP01_5878g1 [Puccinia sorghi]|uniref:Uncharacterized protein n=1 Tax=Puccinia sorghi TaxID=27349 RepID=A0A0L6UI00_9BASI|nr:hypothetical protein VP01_5878g1 [Puccinia sorghi]
MGEKQEYYKHLWSKSEGPKGTTRRYKYSSPHCILYPHQSTYYLPWLLPGQEANTKATEPPPNEGEDRVSKKDKDDNLQVVMGTAPPAFTGGKALKIYNLSEIETLIGLKQCYMNSKRDKEYKVLPQYLEAETISRLDRWSPYKERTIAKTLAKIAK